MSKPATNPEPPDGTRVVVDIGQNDYVVIWRDDAESARFTGDGAHPDDRWFEKPGEDGMCWIEHLKYAAYFYPLGESTWTAVTR